MSDSLFLDPFQVPAEPPAADGAPSDPGPSAPGTAGDAIPGTVVESVPSSEAAQHTVAVLIPLDLVDAAGAFLDDTHLWWPRDHKATDSDGHVFFGDGELREEGTEGEIHRWASVTGAVDGVLELEWTGRRPVPGSSSEPGEGPRVFLSWSAAPDGGTVVGVRGGPTGTWGQDWESLLGAFARFTGGHPVDGDPSTAMP